MNSTLKKLIPHIIAYFILLIISFIYFKPYVFDGKVLHQSDNMQALGMQAEMRKVSKETGEMPLWTNSMFSGMPSYQILFSSDNLIKHPFKAFLLGNHMSPPHTAMLLMFFGIYLLLVTLGVDWRIGIIGAVGFGFGCNFLDLFLAGHSTKIIALSYLAPITAGVLMAYRGKYLLGGAITAFFLSMQLYANHVQITYYLMLCFLILGIVYLIDAYKKQEFPHFFKATGILAIAVLLAVGTSTSRLWTSYEYAQETIRGKSELVENASYSGTSAEEAAGLSKEYLFDWSYGKMETFTLLMPRFLGGGSAFDYSDTKLYKRLAGQVGAQQAKQYASGSFYWGTQPFVGGPIYFGALMVFLFFLGAFLVKKPIKWWLVIAVVFTIMLGWGKNFPILNYTLYDYFPMFSKFRAVTMVYGVSYFFLVLLSMLGLQQFFDKNVDSGAKTKALYMAGGITGGLVLLGLLVSFNLDYDNGKSQLPADLLSVLQEDRVSILRADAWRALFYIAAGFGLLWVSVKKNMKPLYAVLGIGLLTIMDVGSIAREYVSSEDFMRAGDKNRIVEAQEVDKQILSDPDPYYRVADFRRNPFANALTSYHHKSIGGYHAAKLMRYQEFYEKYLKDPNNSKAYGMINAKYFINQEGKGQINPDALGNAWFVSSYDLVENGDAEINALANLDPKNKAVIQNKYSDYLNGFTPQFDSTANIQLTSYLPDEMVYQYNANSEQLALFSEIYYPPEKGWNLYLDGEKMEPFIKADFLLRAARLPAGNHELSMKFEPQSYYTGETITLIASLLVILGFLGALFLHFKNNEIAEPTNLPEQEKVVERPVARKTKATKTKKKK